MSNQDAAIAALFQRGLGWGWSIVLVGHEPVLLADSEPEEVYSKAIGEYETVTLAEAYWPEDWKHECGPTAIVDKDDDAGFLDGWGKVYKYTRIRRPRCLSEARRFLRLWQRATGT